jgi:SAM-dependent methyltransferase
MQTRVPRWAIEGVKRVPFAYRAATTARRAIGIAVGPRRVDGVPGRVHPNDTMIDGRDPESVERYLRSGQATTEQFLALAATHVGRVDDLRWMELGCGYGRLIRHLVARVPPAQVSVTDVDPRGVDFCAAEFRVSGYRSDRPSDELELPAVDVLYAVSVVSHLDVHDVDALVRLILRTVRANGVALVSTHGPSTLDHLESYGPGWPPMRPEIGAQLSEKGWAFLQYPGVGPRYGLAWHEPEWLTARIRQLGGDEVAGVEVLPRGLEAHQDLYVVRRAP